MSEFNIVTRKIQIEINSSDKDEKAKHYGILRFFADECRKASNFIVNQQHINFNIRERIKLYNPDINLKYEIIETEITELEKEFKTIKDKIRKQEIKDRKTEIFKNKKELDQSLVELEKDFYSKSGTTSKGENAPVQNSTYQLIAKKFPHLPSYIRSALNDNIFKNIKKDMKDVLIGNKSVRTYRSKIIHFQKSALVNFRFNPELKEFEFDFFKMPIKTRLGRDRSNNMSVLAKYLNGEYQIGDSSIVVEDNKFFLLLIVKIPNKLIQPEERNPEVSVGIDLGVEIPLFITSTNDKWGKQLGNKNSLFHKKISYRKQKQSLQKSLSENSGGHGYKTKMKKLEDIKKAESNYTKTLYHTLSKNVVDYAIEQKAGIIKMEFLEGIGENDLKMKSLVSLWAPRMLQNFIEEKAKKENIEVIYVDPYLTSQTCAHCNHYEENQREKRAYFTCKNPDCKQFNKKQHADRNASLNIAKSNKIVTSKTDCQIKNIKNNN